MSDIKWIKVSVDMFEDSKIEFIRSLPEGDAIIVTWIQMLSIAGQSNMGGYLMVAEGIPYTEQLLSNKLRRQPVLLQFALETLTRLKMIDIEDGPFHISKWEKHQNVEGMEKVRLQTNERVKKHRLKEKGKLETLPSNATVTLQVTHGNAIELELELDKEKDTTSTGDAIKTYQNEIGIMSDTILQLVLDDIKTYGEDWVVEAIQEAAKNNVRKYVYVQSILQRWGRDGKQSDKVVSIQSKQQSPAPPKVYVHDENDPIYQMIKAANGDV